MQEAPGAEATGWPDLASLRPAEGGLVAGITGMNGADTFKFSRGTRPDVEFAAIWLNHLPLYRRLSARALAQAVSRVLVPYIAQQRY